MNDLLQTYLSEIVFRTNMLLDTGASATFAEVYAAIEQHSLVEWLSAKGADMSILLSPRMADERAAVETALRNNARARKGNERRKLGVGINGLCLIIALAVDAQAIDIRTRV